MLNFGIPSAIDISSIENKSYYSNCLIEAIKAKYRIKNIIIYANYEKDRFNIPHFYWKDINNNLFYHFTALDPNLPAYKQLWFEGKVVRYLWHKVNIDNIKVIQF